MLSGADGSAAISRTVSSRSMVGKDQVLVNPVRTPKSTPQLSIGSSPWTSASSLPTGWSVFSARPFASATA